MPEVITHPNGTALSSDGKYRYLLARDLAPTGTPLTCAFIMLNPSTADAEVDDPTIRRCKRYARDWGYSRLMVVNLFAFRATEPYVLIQSEEDVVGPRNRAYVQHAMHQADLVVVAWGATLRNAPLLWRKAIPMVDLIHATGETFCLKITKGGQPAHPLYQPLGAKPMHFCTRTLA